MSHTLKEIADATRTRLLGDVNLQIVGVASLSSAQPGELVFVQEEKQLAEAERSAASAIIAGPFAEEFESTKPLLISDQPRLAFCRAAALFHVPPASNGIHATAVVHPSAKLGKHVTIAEHVIIEQNVDIAENTHVAAGCVISAGAKIGHHCRLYPNVTIYPGTRLGDRVIVHAGSVLGSDGFGYVRDRSTGRYEKFPQIGRLEIEDDVEIGANSTIDRGALDTTRIRRGTKIDNLVHVGHNVQIGEDVVIAAQTGISGSAVIASNVIIGGQVGIADHVHVEEGAILGAQSGIPSNKTIRGRGVVFWGTPARPIKEYLKGLAAVTRLARKER
jgi:UDP-3-O-[3-hydroxymyristoyl] glucosamine N-acyltransferase